MQCKFGLGTLSLPSLTSPPPSYKHVYILSKTGQTETNPIPDTKTKVVFVLSNPIYILQNKVVIIITLTYKCNNVLVPSL